MRQVGSYAILQLSAKETEIVSQKYLKEDS